MLRVAVNLHRAFSKSMPFIVIVCRGEYQCHEVTAVPLPREPGMLLDDIKQTQTGQDSA